MLNAQTLKKLYALYKLLLFLITFIVFLHLKKHSPAYCYIIFFTYLLDAALFFNFDNKYFYAVSLAIDIVFVYFIAKLLSIEEMVIFSVVPLFFSCLLLECFLAVALLGISFFVLLLYSDLNAVFAVLSYVAALFSSYLVKKSIYQKEIIEKREEFEKEFSDKIYIAKRISLEFAHEIRNPLMGISGALEIIKNSKDKKTLNEMIEIAQKEIERANNLTRDFLNLEKPYELNKQSFELCAFLNEISYADKGLIHIFVNCKIDSIYIDADKEMIRRMIDNLIRNSMEAQAEKVKIEVLAEKEYVILLVSDDGEGINIKDDEKNKIFLPFFTTKEQGSGLGLAICKQIAEAHMGSITIDSTNTFKIELKRR